MHLDLPTLFAMTVVITFVIGVLFLMFWRQARDTQALLLWGVAHLCGAGGSALICLRSIIPDSLSIAAANALIIASYGMIWCGIRSFEGRNPSYVAAFTGSALWLAACSVPAFYASLDARIMLASTLAGLYCTLSARECGRGHHEPLPSRGAATILLIGYASLYWVRVPLAALMPAIPSDRVLASPWVPVLCFCAILFSIALAFLFMALTKERAEREQRLAAETDPLTGIPNRRAFVRQAQVHLQDSKTTVALLLFDLDHFKAINDRYGHGIGDAVLTGFSHLALALMPSSATLGRLGGEEFACVVPNIDAVEARRMADDLRASLKRFAVDAFPDLRICTSVGIAIRRPGSATDFDALAREADAALYKAKSHGRDRVEIAIQPTARRSAA